MINSVRRRFTSVQLEVDYNRIRACVRACRVLFYIDVLYIGSSITSVFASFNAKDLSISAFMKVSKVIFIHYNINLDVCAGVKYRQTKLDDVGVCGEVLMR